MAKKSDRDFAAGIGFYKLFWVFFIGCFLGVIVEMVFCYVTNHGLIQSRSGLIYGPFNPVYGFGAVVLTVVLHPLAGRRDLLIFLGALILGSAFEWACSWVQETLFGTTSWDYSHLPFNFGGRTSLQYGFFWGILGLLWVKDIYPRLSRAIERIPKYLGIVLTWVLVVFMILNMTVSGLAVARWARRDDGVTAKDELAVFLDDHYPDDFMREIYPNMNL